ncbi:MAG TPA: hypothetical protein VGL69_17560 [Solirubrobacteraceae bacterium]
MAGALALVLVLVVVTAAAPARALVALAASVLVGWVVSAGLVASRSALRAAVRLASGRGSLPDDPAPESGEVSPPVVVCPDGVGVLSGLVAVVAVVVPRAALGAWPIWVAAAAAGAGCAAGVAAPWVVDASGVVAGAGDVALVAVDAGAVAVGFCAAMGPGVVVAGVGGAGAAVAVTVAVGAALAAGVVGAWPAGWAAAGTLACVVGAAVVGGVVPAGRVAAAAGAEESVDAVAGAGAGVVVVAVSAAGVWEAVVSGAGVGAVETGPATGSAAMDAAPLDAVDGVATAAEGVCVAAALPPFAGATAVAAAGVLVVSGTAVADSEASASAAAEAIVAVADAGVAAGVAAGVVERLGAGPSPWASCARVTSWPSAAANPWCAFVEPAAPLAAGEAPGAVGAAVDEAFRGERPVEGACGVSAIVAGRPIMRPPGAGSC